MHKILFQKYFIVALKKISLTLADFRTITVTSNPASILTNKVPSFSTRVTVDSQNALFSR